MQNAERRERLIAIAMYYFGLADAGRLPNLKTFLDVVDPELRDDLANAIEAGLDDERSPFYPTAEERRAVAETIRQALRELREAK